MENARAAGVLHQSCTWALCAGLLLSAACGEEPVAEDPPGEEGSKMVGEIRGTDALLAIVEHEGEVRAYACNGEERISEWFEGKVDRNGDLELENAAGSTLRATQVDGVFQGDVKLAGGERHDFDGEAMQGPAGMFRVRGEEAELDGIKAGWILDNEGRERGAVQRKGTFERAPGLPANGLRLGGKTYPVFSFDFPTPELPSPAGPIPIPYPNTP